jgi:hypothetical protein
VDALSPPWFKPLMIAPVRSCVVIIPQGPPSAEYQGEAGFNHHLSGYCCYLNTQTPTTSFLQLKLAGRPLAGSYAAGPWVATPMGRAFPYTLRLSATGSSLTCDLLDGGHTTLATVHATSTAYASGGLAFMALDGESSHHFMRFAATGAHYCRGITHHAFLAVLSSFLIVDALLCARPPAGAAGATPTPSPTSPTASPTTAVAGCSAASCAELGWPVELPLTVGWFASATAGVCGASEQAPLAGCSGDLNWGAGRAFCQVRKRKRVASPRYYVRLPRTFIVNC